MTPKDEDEGRNSGIEMKSTKVDKVHDCMNPCLHKDDSSCKLVEVDVVIKRKHTGKAHVTENCDGVTEDKAKYEN